MKNINKKQGGFTLLELLVVIGIMAIIGGAMLASFGGQEDKAARGAATQTIAGVEDAFRIFKATTNNVPNDLESLACMPISNQTDQSTLTAADVIDEPSTATTAAFAVDDAYKFGGESNASGIGGGLGKKVADKFTLVQLPATTSPDADDDGTAVLALNDVGVTNLRYAETAACDNDAATVATIGANTVNGALLDMDIPAHAFEDPRPGANNRGRGFSATLTAGAPVMLWDPGTAGYNNTKVGAEADSVLIGVGLGQASDLVGSNNDAAFAKAPFYGQVGKDKYAHYIALLEIGIDENTDGDNDATTSATTAFADTTWSTEGKAKVVAVLDARGDFLDEEFAEFTGQKD